MINVALVGVGPHSKRIYLNYLKKHKINLELVIELESKKNETKKYLNSIGFKKTKIFTLKDKYKDCDHLPEDISLKLLAVCETLEITHLFISTEPKAHFMYIEFGLKNNINVLTDKPITVAKNMTSLKSINKVRNQYYQILHLAENSKASCKVMCQRQYHRGYEEIKKVLTDVVSKYQVPITNIEIFHSDGNWEMPHDLEKENHPYKYGYGKLFHSGYHFIDLLSDFIKINEGLKDPNKKIASGDVYSKVFTPNDELACINIEDYKRLFAEQNIPNFYNENSNPNFNKYGEKNYHGLLTFYNRQGFTITSANLNLLHDGVSRRSWIESKDFYKQNGRIRHERINIEVGHLLNIQVHSYQSKEIGDRTNNEESVGGLEHFDIYFFNNPLVDKVPFKEIHLGDMYSKEEKEEFMGYNELSREIFLNNFLNDKDCKGDIRDQALAIEILYSCAKGIHNHYNHKNKIESINVRNDYTYPFMAKDLKCYSNSSNIDEDKKLINDAEYYKDIYCLYAFERFIPSQDCYEVYMSIGDPKGVAGSLLYKTFKYKFTADCYFKILKYILKRKNIFSIKRIIMAHSKFTK